MTWPGQLCHDQYRVHDSKTNSSVYFSLLCILKQSSSSSIARSSGWSTAPWTRRGFPLPKASSLLVLEKTVPNHGRRSCIYTRAKLMVVLTVEEGGARHPLLSLRSSCQLLSQFQIIIFYYGLNHSWRIYINNASHNKISNILNKFGVKLEIRKVEPIII